MAAGRPGEPSLRVTSRIAEPGVVGIAVAGEMDLSTATRLAEALASALSEHRPRRVELDLRGVPFMDSSGINLLVRSRRLAGEAGCELVVSGIRQPVYRVLSIFGLVELLCPGVLPENGAPEEGTSGSVA